MAKIKYTTYQLQKLTNDFTDMEKLNNLSSDEMRAALKTARHTLLNRIKRVQKSGFDYNKTLKNYVDDYIENYGEKETKISGTRNENLKQLSDTIRLLKARTTVDRQKEYLSDFVISRIIQGTDSMGGRREFIDTYEFTSMKKNKFKKTEYKHKEIYKWASKVDAAMNAISHFKPYLKQQYTSGKLYAASFQILYDNEPDKITDEQIVDYVEEYLKNIYTSRVKRNEEFEKAFTDSNVVFNNSPFNSIF